VRSAILVIELEISAPANEAPKCESTSQATYRAMRECFDRGESWQDAMDRGEPHDE